MLKGILNIRLIAFVLLTGIFLFLASPLVAQTSTDELEKQISELTSKLLDLSKAKDTLTNQINILNSQITLTLLKITQTESTITILESEIKDLGIKIDKLDINLNQLSGVFLDQVSQNYKLQKRIPPVFGLLTGNFNSFYQQYKYLEVLQQNNHDLLLSMETTRTNYNTQKDLKAKKQQELALLEKTLASQKLNLLGQKDNKSHLLEVTKNDEKTYQQELREALAQLTALKNFSKTAGGSCLSSSPGAGSDGNFFSQRDPSWCRQYIGLSTDTIGEVGCYISSIAMVYKKLGNNTINPSAYAANPSNFFGLTAYMDTPLPPSGYNYQQVGYKSSIIDSELTQGRYVIAQMRMPGTVVGMHFIVIISGSNGNYKIHDPWYGPDLDFSTHYSASSIMSLRLITK